MTCPHCSATIVPVVHKEPLQSCPDCGQLINLDGTALSFADYRRENSKAIDKMHPGNRLRLMASYSLLPEEAADV